MRRIRTTRLVPESPVGPLRANAPYLVPPDVAAALTGDGAAVYVDWTETAEASGPHHAERAVSRDRRLTPVGGGWYRLPDGRKVQGIDNALRAVGDGDD